MDYYEKLIFAKAVSILSFNAQTINVENEVSETSFISTTHLV